MVQRLLSSAEFKMDPLVSLYYFAPACAVMNGFVALVVEVPRLTMADIYNVGLFILLANAIVAFMLNVSVVLLVSSENLGNIEEIQLTQSTARKDQRSRPYTLWSTQGYPPSLRFHAHLPRSRRSPPVLRLQHCAWRSRLLQARS
jgi:asparagine N-glycosylation enzyme membrane subunit Stt3